MTKTITAAGRSWHVTPLDIGAAFEVEVMFIHVFGAAAAFGVAAAVEGLVPALIDAARKLTGEGEDFDLARLLTLLGIEVDEDGDTVAPTGEDAGGLDTRDPRLREAWETMLGALADTAGEMVVRALPTITDRLDLDDVRRLFELVVIRGCCPVVDGKGARLADWAAANRLLVGHPPAAKWELLGAALLVTYGSATDEGEG